MGSRLAAAIGFLSADAFLLEAQKPGVSTGPGVPTVWVVKGKAQLHAHHWEDDPMRSDTSALRNSPLP